jgi:hypothetical protein
MVRIFIFSALALAACAPTAVVSYNGDSIRIQSASATVTPEVLSEAQRICGTRGLQAEYASTAYNEATFTSYHLFLCLSSTKPNAGLPTGATRNEPNYLETTSTL